MVDLWLPNAARHIYPKKQGGVYDRLEPKKLCLHTTEGTSIASALSAYAPYPPHIVCSYREKKVIQHIPLNRSSYSLASSEAEDEPVIQVEIMGFAAQSRDWPKAELDWYIDNVFFPIWQLWPYALVGAPQGFKDQKDGIRPYIASKTSPIRFKMSDFEKFGGIFGHQHSPSPDHHWDPGAINIDYIISRLKEKSNQSTTVKGNEQMAITISEEVKNRVTYWYNVIFDRTPNDAERNHWATITAERGPEVALHAIVNSEESILRDAHVGAETLRAVKELSAAITALSARVATMEQTISTMPTQSVKVELPSSIVFDRRV